MERDINVTKITTQSFHLLATEGGVVRNPRVESFHVFSGVGSIGTVLVCVQFIFVFVLIYQIIREVTKVKNQRHKYFKEPWNYIEVSVIVTSFVSVAMYVAREFLSRSIERRLKENRGRCECLRTGCQWSRG